MRFIYVSYFHREGSLTEFEQTEVILLDDASTRHARKESSSVDKDPDGLRAYFSTDKQ